ncbi:MAG TPA: phosphatidylserine decarboxylase family protein [Pyrinomonadaceae bacterium]|nr:phosphatidylserine decarboxylase family protein [Pyrinomonadaceae bacterium]
MKIAREGFAYVGVPALVAIVLFVFGLWWVALFFVVISAFMLYFFRDPRRIAPTDPDVVVSPADGRVTRVAALSPESESSSTLVSIFLSPLDVHINRSPIAGKITKVSYTSGKFLMATDERASLVNEQNALTIEGERISIVCKQIAGILARRIVCWKSPGDRVALGERFGLIKFSSRTDVILPENVKVTVQEGMKVRGGTTIIGRIER